MKKVLLGMSGGVDSSVAAVLLRKKGYEVVGITMQLYEGSCCNSSAVLDAKSVCKKLGMEHFIPDCKNDFMKYVIEDFIREYKNGRTPNPCIECNRYFKFGVMYKIANDLGCDYVSTGHYARTEWSDKYNQYVLKKSKEEKKDQTYFLYTIPRKEIEHLLFPLQDIEMKEDTRKIAEENGLLVARKKDSQEICFIANNDYKAFLNNNIKKEEIKTGKIVLSTGKVLGKHNGLINYTIGQRKGLGISYDEPLYVVDINTKTNELIVGTEKELYNKELIAKDLNWLIFDELKEPIECFAKIRYRAALAKAKVYPENDKVKVVFEVPQRAITKGQSVVFYDEDGVMIGGGKIC